MFDCQSASARLTTATTADQSPIGQARVISESIEAFIATVVALLSSRDIAWAVVCTVAVGNDRARITRERQAGQVAGPAASGIARELSSRNTERAHRGWAPKSILAPRVTLPSKTHPACAAVGHAVGIEPANTLAARHRRAPRISRETIFTEITLPILGCPSCAVNAALAVGNAPATCALLSGAAQ